MAVPSAVPTTGLFSSCNFTDRDSLLSMVDSDGQRFNISLLAQACPQLCPLAYGTGNPDMTGIGVGDRIIRPLVTADHDFRSQYPTYYKALRRLSLVLY